MRPKSHNLRPSDDRTAENAMSEREQRDPATERDREEVAPGMEYPGQQRSRVATGAAEQPSYSPQ
jgi:hypothetical protein